MPEVAEPPQTGSAVPPSTGTLNVSQMPKSAAPRPEPKPGSAKAQMRADLQKKAGLEVKPTEPTPEPKPEAKTEPKPFENPVEKVVEPPKPEAKVDTKPDTKPEDFKAKDGRVNPWKLTEHYKGLLAQREAEIADLKSRVTPESDRKSFTEKSEALEKRNKELEDEIRYVNYSKSKEFQEKYQTPYENAFRSAMRDMDGVVIVGENGSSRPFNMQDLLAIVNTPAASAAKLARQLTGDDDVGNFAAMRAEKIRDLFAAQHQALEEAKGKASEREKEIRETMAKSHSEIVGFIKENWPRVNDEFLNDPKNGEYFKQREGDEEWNSRLEKGYELANKAFELDPRDPKLTPEDRMKAIRRHAAVRHLAASWRPLKYENGKLKKQVEELTGELKKYKDSAPQAGGTGTVQTNGGTASAREQMMQKLQGLARPIR